jgi:hypothetical protein
MLHIPLCSVKNIPFDVAVIYRPRANEIASAYFTRRVNTNGLQTMMPIGEPIANAEQAHRTKSE